MQTTTRPCSSWRVPTEAEWKELQEQCEWTWTTQDGHEGYEVKAQNGNMIFIPAAGWSGGFHTHEVGESGFYWSSSLGVDSPSHAYRLCFGPGEIDGGDFCRFIGRSVRPVFD